ncbi:MAG: KH domain-containing protein [Candidatus ainarchaeum sp.]|nr:KH domain-containing protein [Candidatus ainarchaeum sp.]
MNGPICFEDAKTNRLCRICEAKLKANIINENDVAIWKEIVKLGEKSFLDLDFLNSFELNGMLVIVCRGNIGALIGRQGKNIRDLEQKLGKKIRIVEKTGDAKETAQALLGFVKIAAVNRVFRPDSEELKIIISRNDERRLKEKEALEKILSKILGSKTTVEFQ